MLAIYLSKTYHKSAPVAWLASEKGVDFVIDIFKAEGVPLLLNRSRSFLDLRAASRDAQKEGACAVCTDSITHFWQELFTEGMRQNGPRLQKIGRIKEEWAPFSQDFQDSPIHFLVTGRLGFTWEEYEIENERGEVVKELSKGDTKIKAEGDFGHEPDLEIQMSLDLIRDRIPVFREMSANLGSRFVNTVSAHDGAAGMNPETIFGVRLRKQFCTPDGIEFDKDLVKVAHEQFRRSCVHNWLSLNVLSGFLKPHEARFCRVSCVLALPAH